ncbi:MAG: hypothetical protein K2L14_01970 [Duncaniella sp.]|nr:hypothetical protein [Duncaniella sp.]
MKLSRYISFLFAIPALIFTACEDELPYDSYAIGEGDANVSAQVEFRSLEPALDSRAAGNAVNTIDELWMVIYKFNADGTEAGLYEKVKIYDKADNYYVLPGSNFQIDQTGNSGVPGDASTVTPPSGTNVGPNDGAVGATGEVTPRASFKLPNIPYGRYKMFAVANVDLTDVDCTTVDALRKTRFKWNTDVKLDNQMFGYFTLTSQQTSNAEAPLITLNQPEVSLHAWVKRLVSKVTVSFDASDLKDNVRIYIKSVTIHDIPEYCYLGEKNTPTDTLQLIRDGESFTYYKPGEDSNADHDKWDIQLSKGEPYGGETDHTEADRALYFFENMQGNYEGQSQYDKRQNPDEVGKLVDYPSDGPDYKDAKLCGTYIEVEAYYDSRHKDKISQGPIKYRFMLGKNSTFNYDAERNYHYKLTLKFRGWANEVDWHIHYKEYTRTLITPEPYYISYLYGQEMDFPARVLLLPEDNPADFAVKAEIVENNWWPWDRDYKNADGTLGARPGQFVPSSPDNGMRFVNGFAWNLPAFEDVYTYQKYTRAAYAAVGQNFVYGGSNYVGFLSLKPITSISIGDTYPGKGSGDDTNGYGPKANEFLESAYKETGIAYKSYSLSGTDAFTDPVDKSIRLKIPMYTREKQMVNATDFSGNNPFNNYSRFAKVRFTLLMNGNPIPFKDENGNEETERIATIYQVPRLENPKAIYRDWNNDDEFEVVLMQPSVVDASGNITYSPFKSDGPWRAYIMAETESFIQLTGPDGKVKTAVGKDNAIEGSTDEIIQFTYKPSSKLSSSNQTRCGVIKVEYHDYNCAHLIFVRQGYHRGVKLGDATWSCYNVYSSRGAGTDATTLNSKASEGNVTLAQVNLTRSPLSIGSFYKRNQYNYGILESNNATYGWMTSLGTNNLSTTHINANNTVAAARNSTWSTIEGAGWYKRTEAWATQWNAVAGTYENGVRFRVPTASDFNSLLTSCQFGFGIAYADGSKAVATTLAAAAGFYDYNNDGVDDAPVNGVPRGVRACVVYEDGEGMGKGRNILFPLGATGQGRRTLNQVWNITGTVTTPWPNTISAGSLSYGGVKNVMTNTANMYRPLTYNLYRQVGALYWLNVPNVINNAVGSSYGAWDINYNTVRFNPHDNGSIGGANFTTTNNNTDAMPIKLVYVNQVTD